MHAGKHTVEIGVMIHGRNQDVVFVFLLYTPVSTISLILVRSGERERERESMCVIERMNQV